VTSSGEISGGGTINGNVVSSGLLAPGASPGLLTINGDFTQQTLGILEVDIAGPTPAEFDRLVVSGKATLAGKLKVIRAPPFTPLPGNSFEFLRYGTHEGNFTFFEGLEFPGGQLGPREACSRTVWL
jgi:hypothetical protein